MELKVADRTLDLDICMQFAMKGSDETDLANLQENLRSNHYAFTCEKEKNETIITVLESFETELVLEYVQKYKTLKAVALFDSFNSAKVRHSYLLYSEANKKTFTKYTYLGWSDGQADTSFSGQVNMLSPKTQSFSGKHTLTGINWKIKYQFPYELEWNDGCGPDFVLNGRVLIKYTGNSENIEIPAGIEIINNKAFQKCKSIRTLKLPKTVKAIFALAFSECDNLKEIYFSEGLQFIGTGAFLSCNSLTEIVLPTSLTKDTYTPLTDSRILFKEHSEGSFCKCENLHKVTLGKKMKKIPSSWFAGCLHLEEIDLPNSITHIGADAFYNCKSLKTIDLPSGLKKIGDKKNNPFDGCDNLTLNVTKGSLGEEHAQKYNMKYNYL